MGVERSEGDASVRWTLVTQQQILQPVETVGRGGRGGESSLRTSEMRSHRRDLPKGDCRGKLGQRSQSKGSGQVVTPESVAIVFILHTQTRDPAGRGDCDHRGGTAQGEFWSDRQGDSAQSVGLQDP
jgi:hypothetical protein